MARPNVPEPKQIVQARRKKEKQKANVLFQFDRSNHMPLSDLIFSPRDSCFSKSLWSGHRHHSSELPEISRKQSTAIRFESRCVIM